jgi:hypothetical protein
MRSLELIGVCSSTPSSVLHPTEPHWYLPLIGVDVERHGFEELSVIQAGESSPMWPMLRTVSFR